MMPGSNSAELQEVFIDGDTGDRGLVSAASALATVQTLLRNRFAGKPVRIYEAGGGAVSYLPPEVLRNAEITVVDIDETQLRNNQYARSKICGDIQTEQFPPESFDLVVCYNVIEHIERPDRAVDRFLEALAPGGLVFIAAPNPYSLSGLVTRFTPHWFHVWFYRVALGRKDAGRPGHAPFPVVYHPLVVPRRLIEFCRARGCRIVYFREFETSHLGTLRNARPVAAKVLDALTRGLELILRRSLRLGDFHILIERPPQ
ncbi:MAG TPA: class I SAM-dependent methyltransferase [Xanthobacteraceae bacterium]|nr:class I SAM-dependent methyltransferase [Xanthobacteraceae bacterium]